MGKKKKMTQSKVVLDKNNEINLINTTDDGVIIKISSTEELRKNQLALNILNSIDLGNALGNLSSNTKYVLDIPIKYRNGLESGKYFIMENKETGKMYANLMQNVDGKKKIVTPLGVKKEDFINGNAINRIFDRLHDQAIESMISDTLKSIDDLKEEVRDVRQILNDDRLGKIMSGKRQIAIACKSSNEEDKRMALAVGRQSVYEGLSSFEETLKNKLLNFQPIPKDNLKIKWEILKDPDYMDKKDNQYYEIQDLALVQSYGTNMLAASYLAIGEYDQALEVYNQSEQYISLLDMSKIRTIQNIHTHENCDNMWFSNPSKKCLENKEKAISIINDQKMLSLEIDGKVLMEVVKNEREE